MSIATLAGYELAASLTMLKHSEDIQTDILKEYSRRTGRSHPTVWVRYMPDVVYLLITHP